MKVCFFIHSMGFGGAERTISYLANFGVNNGIDVDVVVIDDEKNSYKLDNKVNLINIGYNLDIKKRHNSIFGKVFGVINSTIKVKTNFKKYLKLNNPDVVFCMSESVVRYVPKNHKFKLIGTERSNPNWIKSKSVLRNRRKAYNRCDALVFQTARAKEYYKDCLSVKNQIVIPNAIGNEFCYDITYNTQEFKKKISAVGSLRAQKDYPTMIKAFSIVVSKHNDFILEIFGEGPDKENIKLLCKELDIIDKVEFRGNDIEAIKKISDSCCYVMSSISEGMPNSLMEAMAIGMPCVSTDCDNGPAELIENGINGLLVPIQDAQALADAMCKMIEDREFAEKCGNEAKKILKTNSINETSNRYYNFIENILKG